MFLEGPAFQILMLQRADSHMGEKVPEADRPEPELTSSLHSVYLIQPPPLFCGPLLPILTRDKRDSHPRSLLRGREPSSYLGHPTWSVLSNCQQVSLAWALHRVPRAAHRSLCFCQPQLPLITLVIQTTPASGILWLYVLRLSYRSHTVRLTVVPSRTQAVVGRGLDEGSQQSPWHMSAHFGRALYLIHAY